MTNPGPAREPMPPTKDDLKSSFPLIADYNDALKKLKDDLKVTFHKGAYLDPAERHERYKETLAEVEKWFDPHQKISIDIFAPQFRENLLSENSEAKLLLQKIDNYRSLLQGALEPLPKTYGEVTPESPTTPT